MLINIKNPKRFMRITFNEFMMNKRKYIVMLFEQINVQTSVIGW